MANAGNNVHLIGRLVKDPDVRYSSDMAIARFSLAINRGKDAKGNEKGADFPNIVAFGKTAETIEKYMRKGCMMAVSGELRTGSYEKDGRKYYTTEVAAERVLFLSFPDQGGKTADQQPTAPEGFSAMGAEDDIPFFN